MRIPLSRLKWIVHISRRELFRPHLDGPGLTIAGVDVSSDGRRATARIGKFSPLQCYELTWRLVAADRAPAIGRLDGTVHAAR